MGLENMRRWPMYIVFAVCILLFLSLFNSWGMETELRENIDQISRQLSECSKQQSSCMEESQTLIQQRDTNSAKMRTLEKQNKQLDQDVSKYKDKADSFHLKVNRTLVDFEICNKELQSLKMLEASKTAMLETLKIDKDTLLTQLNNRQDTIDSLQKEIDQLKRVLNSKSASSKMTPAAPVPKISASLNAHEPLHEPILENAEKQLGDNNNNNDDKSNIDDAVAKNNGIDEDLVKKNQEIIKDNEENVIHQPAVDSAKEDQENAAKEDLEDTVFNDGNDFDPSIH